MLPTGIIDSISEGYDSLWRAFIRPHKTSYMREDLGFAVGIIVNQVQERQHGFYVRDDFFVKVPGASSQIAVSLYYMLSPQVVDPHQGLCRLAAAGRRRASICEKT